MTGLTWLCFGGLPLRVWCEHRSILFFFAVMVYSLLFRFASRYSTALLLPVSAALGFLGYKIEGILSDKYTPSLKSIKEKREERLLNEEKETDSIKEHKFVPKTIFEKNLSPSLVEPDPRQKKYSVGT